ncbi:hypothetical protein [Aquimarina algiphila]|uniref:Uncharacterized protein n=1 Tax=Aquimarina algiphila TaxID=2047982 RepID=A0A554VNQ9_9FLAO|nr:hypothetical protein [Aquimarina algiphila]TSE10003.1 hypothetical protein FOF46_06795 [Aquimarina algiphila]
MRAELESNERTTFRYVLDRDTKDMAGILCTNSTQLSMSFLNGSDLEINSLETLLTDTLELPPNKRILSWQQDLTSSRVLVGNIRNMHSKKQRVSLYLLTYKTTSDEK